MVSVVVILLLAGCQRSDQKGPAKTAIQSGKEPADSLKDSLKKDSVEAFDERMMRWRVLHGGMSRWESDK